MSSPPPLPSLHSVKVSGPGQDCDSASVFNKTPGCKSKEWGNCQEVGCWFQKVFDRR